MSVGHDRFVVRIRSSSGGVVGAGFLAGESLIVTCAHVVAAATGIDGDTSDLPSAQVTFDFPLIAPDTMVVAAVVGWMPMSARGGDIAILQVRDGLLTGAHPAPLVASGEVWGHAFRAFGFPAGHDDGVWAAGVLRDRQGGGWVQIDDADQVGYRVQPGFSGGPVFDETLDGVVGMAVAADVSPEVRSAWLIPTETLVAAWPQLVTKVTPACPYPGLRNFRESDSALFFGRQAFVRDRLLPATRRDPLVAMVVGASGAGKSSVVHAGLFPALPADEGWHKRSFRPGTVPFEGLAAVLIDWLGPTQSETDRMIETKKLGDSLRDSDLTLAQVVERLDQKAEESQAHRYVLFIDQFEELFGPRVDPVVRRRFLDALVETITLERGRSTPRFTVVMAMRADFLFQALAHRPFSDVLQDATQLLGPMTREELRDAIVQPAIALGVTFQDGLVDRILDDVGDDPGRLPLLQFALTLLWAEQTSRELTHAAYEGIGEVRGALVGYASTVFERLTEHERESAHRLFIQLVQPGTPGKETRRIATRSELSPEQWDIAQRLSYDRLVVVGSDPAMGIEFVDLIHETLINAWPQLRMWVDTDREFRLWQERLRGALGQWETSGRDPSFLLRGGPLVVAEGWLDRSGGDLVEDERTYITESIEHRRAEQAARGRTRRLLTLAAVGTAAVFIVLAIVAGFQWLAADTERQRAEDQRQVAEEQRQVAEQQRGVAEQQQQLAEDQRRLALSRQLAAQAVSQRRLDRALLLSLEANRFSPTAQARASLLAGLTTSPQISAYLDASASTVQDVDFSPDGTMLASAGDREVVLWDVVSRTRIGEPLRGHADAVTAVDFSLDGRILASGGADGEVIFWDVAGRTQIGEPLQRHWEPVIEVAFSPDGSVLAVAGDQMTKLWDVVGRTPIGDPIRGYADTVASMSFSPDGTLLALGGYREIILWDVAGGSRIGELDGQSASVSSLAFSPGGTMLASGGYGADLILWDVPGRRKIVELPEGHTHIVSSVAFSRDSKLLASAGYDGKVILWGVEGRARIGAPLEGHGGRVASVTFGSDGTTLASAGYDSGTIILWDVVGRSRVGELLERRSECCDFAGVAFSPDSTMLATAGFDERIVFWDVAGSRRVGEVLEANDVDNLVAFSPDGTTLASAGTDGEIILWDVARRRRIGELLQVDRAPFGGALEGLREVLPDSVTSIFPAASDEPTVVSSVAFSPDGTLLASAQERSIIIWDVASRSPIGESLEGHDDWVRDAVFSPDGKLLASADGGKRIFIWDTATRRLDGEPLEGHTDSVWSLAFSRDGKTLASAGADEEIILWDTATRRRVGQPLEGHDDGISSLVFSPDGTSLASAGGDGSIILWDVASGTEIGRLGGDPPSSVWGLAFSPDGAWLASGGDTVMLWDTDLHRWEAKACEVANRNLDRDEWRQYVGAEEYQVTCPGLPVPAEPTTAAPSPA
jgi:WD40 repeat protein